MTNPNVLICGCVESVVRARYHQEGCPFVGQGADYYPWMRRWGAAQDATTAEMVNVLDRAQATNAPLDTFWEGADVDPPNPDDDSWLTVDQIKSPMLRARVGVTAYLVARRKATLESMEMDSQGKDSL